LPAGSPAFYILLSLANSEKHGYAIMKDIEALSGGETSLSTSTLYEALSRLLEQGLIERVETGEEQDGRRLRKAYRLSRLGRQALDAETARLEGLVRQAHLRLLKGER
jgi:DNA-binding PadR family transcriptional regulator